MHATETAVQARCAKSGLSCVLLYTIRRLYFTSVTKIDGPHDEHEHGAKEHDEQRHDGQHGGVLRVAAPHFGFSRGSLTRRLGGSFLGGSFLGGRKDGLLLLVGAGAGRGGGRGGCGASSGGHEMRMMSWSPRAECRGTAALMRAIDLHALGNAVRWW
jgi:hypothetical protein